MNNIIITQELYDTHRMISVGGTRKIPIGRRMLYNIEWLYDMIDSRLPNSSPIREDTTELYIETINIIKECVRLFYMIYPDYDDNQYEKHDFFNPENIFDAIILYNNDLSDWYYCFDVAIDFFKKIEYIVYTVKNRIDEWEFDVVSQNEYIDEMIRV
jgi:hypothetical protein